MVNDQDIPQDTNNAQAFSASPQQGEPVLQKTDYWGYIVLAAGVGALFWGLVSAVGTGWGFWEYTSGLKGVAGAFLLGLGAILIGAVQGWRVRKAVNPPPRARRWVGMGVALAYVAWVGTFLMAALTVPAIHDVSTDLADPPAFQTLTLRADNLDNIPGADDADMRGLTPLQRWAVVHQKAYGDIRSVRSNEPVPMVIAKAERLAKARGWEVAVSLPEEGRFEATETSAFFQFKDDVVLRVRPSETGEGSIVDMRSVSRVGVSDLGMNAKRVRAFLADLTGTVAAAP
ncbi:MAG: DUF1499 domain-containing protein [Sphingomonadaceae bacterium]|jgi:hypothetical protein|uniref:DUF1499 domain-containing protein n=1 Tax=Sphingorhabdus sp. TaxID=1902408 RepID=UPI0039BCBB5C|nr:DUF1499 domain-containing protein [Sphingomonadaceae bacterium]